MVRAIALSLTIVSTAAAQADIPKVSTPSRIVTLEEALAAADSIPEIAAARATLRGAEAGIRGAQVPAEPTLTLATRSVSARESVAVSVPFRWGGQRSAAVAAAKAQRDSSSRSLDAAVADARRLARTDWYALAAAEDLLRGAEELLAQSEKNRAAIVDLLEMQRASKIELSRATAEAATASAARAKTARDVDAASAELRTLLGAGDGPLSTGPERPLPPAVESLEECLARARASSPSVAVAAAELRAAEARLKQRSRENRPITSLEAGADWNDPTQPGTDGLLGLGITFPTRGRSAVDAATADRDRAAAELTVAERRVAADVEAAWSSVVTARVRFEAADGIARPAALEAAELTRIAYREGKLDLFRLLDTERALAESERDRAEAYKDWGGAYADLLRLAPIEAP